MSQYEHVMIDLETMGINNNAPILSIGAVQFDPDTGETGGALYEKINWVDDQQERTIDRSTIAWWLQQEEAARMELIDKTNWIKLALALHRLDVFIPKGAQVWANGNMFDIAILDDAYATHVNRKPPWGFRQPRDCRTLKEIAKPFVDFSQFVFEGTTHNALDDCFFQIQWTSACWQALRNNHALNLPELQTNIS